MSESERRRGRPPHPDVLTPGEWRVLELLREGLTNAEIGERLGVSVHAVKFHVSNMLSKLGLEGREDLARWKPETARERMRSRLGSILGLLKLGGGVKVGASIAMAGAGLGAGAVLFAMANAGDDDPPSQDAEKTPETGALPDVTPSLAVTSFRLVQHEVRDIDTPPGSGQHFEQRREVAFRAPDNRADVTRHIRPDQAVTYQVHRGTKRWFWGGVGDHVTEIDVAPFGIGASQAFSQFGWPFQASDLDQLIRVVMAGQDVQHTSTTTVAGRPVMEITLTANKCFTGGYEDVEGERRMWVDTETLFVLKFEQRGKDGNVSLLWEVLEIEYNEALPDSTFEFPRDRTISVLVSTPVVPSVTPPATVDGCANPAAEFGSQVILSPVESRFATATPTP